MQNVLAIFLFVSWPFSDSEGPTPEITELHNQVKNYYQTNLDSAILLAEQTIIKSRELNDDFGQAKSVTLLAQAYNLQGKTDQAVYHFLDALKLFMPIENTTSLSVQANICLSVGKIYRQHYRINEAIDFYDKGINYAVRSSDQKVFAKLLHNKAVVYRKIGEPAKAKELLMQKLEMVATDDYDQKQKTYNQLGLAYHELKDFDQARVYYQQMIDLETGYEPSRFRGQAFHNLANTYQEQGDYEQAWYYYHKSLAEKEPLNRAKDLFITYQDMANLALLQDQRILALSYADKATLLLDKVPKTLEYYDQYHLLSNCIGESNPKQALAYSNQYFAENKMFISLQEELIEIGQGYKMDLITMTYFKVQREKEQQQRFYLTLFSGLAFLLVAAFTSSRLWKIYRYKSPEVALSMIKNPKEMIYLIDLFRNEKEELKKLRRQEEK